MTFQPYPIEFNAGIQRDGTELDSPIYVDGRWCRFQRGKPRKMWGYKRVSANMTAISRALHLQTSNGYTYVHSGFASGIESFQIDQFGQSSVPAPRTPGGFVNNANNVWQMDSYYDTGTAAQQILAFQIPALMDISYGSTTGNLYAGPIYAVTALTPVSGLATDATGGICSLPPYLIVYGSNGLVQWSAPAKPLDFVSEGSGAARVTDQKIVRALPLMGGAGFSPSGLLWSINKVIRFYFVGGAPVFAFDPLPNDTSILSHNAVVRLPNGLFVWIGQDRFLSTEGATITEIPNNNNINFFFDNLNRQYAQKAFAFKNPRWGEVWFCAPLFGATEPNWAVIYNYREQTWYDTQLPNSGRSFGVKNDVGVGMMMSGIDLYNNATYRLWQHEYGLDEADGNLTSAISSTYTTGIITANNFQQPMDKAVKIDTIEPDYLLTGEMQVTPYTRGNARSPFVAAPTQRFSGTTATEPLAQQVPLKTTAKQTKLKFESNVAGGDFQAGKLFAYIELDQARRTK